MSNTLSTLEKLSRADAFSVILKMKTENTPPTGKGLDALLNYFAPAVPKKAKSVMQWVGKACSPKDVREMCRYIHVKNGEAIATDGSRMHWGATDLPDGQYDPKTLLKMESEMDQRMVPDFERVKKIHASETYNFYLGHASHHMTTSRTGKPSQHTILGKNGDAGAVNTRYLNDATNGDNTLLVTVDANGDLLNKYAPTNGCSGESEFGSFRIMGMRP